MADANKWAALLNGCGVAAAVTAVSGMVEWTTPVFVGPALNLMMKCFLCDASIKGGAKFFSDPARGGRQGLWCFYAFSFGVFGSLGYTFYTMHKQLQDSSKV
eukprot:TRINITY_DN84824_c0_g1_i1.p2 TRINITY_DN84824_c0_g1~~TRINITY_DN84824_c0_g1_i1.p2  ORF type:complete len:102 (-),score=18.94 TRINITY_DN84824_c0_g1_i1:155-460(-)